MNKTERCSGFWYAAMARALGLTRARVTQLMDLLLIAADIQADILSLKVASGDAQPFSERALREALSSLIWTEQREAWRKIRSAVPSYGFVREFR